MDIVDRITSLHEAGKPRVAATLAREALRNDGDVSVDIGELSVHVESTHFEGAHPIEGYEDGELLVAKRGEYRVRGQTDVSFVVYTVPDNVFAALNEAETERQRREGPWSPPAATEDRQAADRP